MLFKNTDTLKGYAEFTEINFESVQLTIKQVESFYLVPALGNSQYAELNNAYQLATTEDVLSSAHKNLLELCRMLIGPYVMYNYVYKTDVQISDAGARRSETANQKTAFGYQIENLREQKLTEAENATEDLLKFLFNNKSSYPEWTSSEAYADYQSLFIKSGSEFDRCFKTATPFRNYWAWRYKMQEVEENNIRAALTNDVFNDLKAKDIAGSVLSANEALLLFRVKKAIAYLTVSFAIPFHNVRIDSNGLTIIAPSLDKEKSSRRAAADDAVTQLMRNSADAGSQWLKQAVDLLKQYPADFPLYPQPQTDGRQVQQPGNEECSGSFGLY